MERFEDADRSYLAWLKQHPSGYVLNVLRTHASSGAMLHRSECFTIRNEAFRRAGWTTGFYVKVCSPSREALRNWSLRFIDTLPPDCLKCKP